MADTPETVPLRIESYSWTCPRCGTYNVASEPEAVQCQACLNRFETELEVSNL